MHAPPALGEMVEIAIPFGHPVRGRFLGQYLEDDIWYVCIQGSLRTREHYPACADPLGGFRAIL